MPVCVIHIRRFSKLDTGITIVLFHIYHTIDYVYIRMIQLSMIKKLYGINLDVELKSKLDTIAKNKFKSSSSIINELIFKYVKEHDIMGNKIQNNGTENLTKFF